ESRTKVRRSSRASVRGTALSVGSVCAIISRGLQGEARVVGSSCSRTAGPLRLPPSGLKRLRPNNICHRARPVAPHFHAHRKPTAFLCHGPIATIAAMPNAREFRAALIAGDTAKASELAKGWQYSGYKMTVFSITEEKVIEEHILHAKLYFNMVDALRIAGGEVNTTAIDFAPNVGEDRELITGQNPRSDKPIAARLGQALGRRAATAL